MDKFGKKCEARTKVTEKEQKEKEPKVILPILGKCYKEESNMELPFDLRDFFPP